MTTVYCNERDCVHNDGSGCCEANSINLTDNCGFSPPTCTTRKVLIPGISNQPKESAAKTAAMLEKTRWGL